MSKEKAVQKKYIVKISKTFEYPSSVVDESHLSSDLLTKVTLDFTDYVDKHQSVSINYFDVSIGSEVPYSPPREDPERHMPMVDVDLLIKELVTAEAVDKFGTLDPEKNPDLYEEQEFKIFGNDDEVTNVIKTYRFGDKLEQFWSDRFGYYLDILDKIQR